MRLNDLIINLEQTIGKTLQCVEILPWREYREDGVKGKQMGYKFVCLCPKLNYDKIVIKQKCDNISINVDDHPVRITYENATCTPYYNSNHKVELSIVAEKVTEDKKQA